MRMSPEAVRVAMLAAQGLLNPPRQAATRADLLPFINQMGYLQIDTIQAVRRSQYLVLWSRLGDYDPGWLDEIYNVGKLFEYYAHALCYLPITDYPIFRGMILNDSRTGNDWSEWAQAHPEIIQQVREIVTEKGPVSTSDFDSKTISIDWGDVKLERIALHRLFSTGEVMVAYRKKFRRYYDLRERILPAWDDSQALSYEQAREKLILKTIHALGVAREDWIAPYYYLTKTGLSEILEELIARGLIKQVSIDGWDQPAFIDVEYQNLIQDAADGKLQTNLTTLLSPFDPLVSDRDRALALFDFDYKMESYTPAKKRQYGYFCLPILHNGRLVGRLDPKAHRKEKRMEIKKIYLEPWVEMEANLTDALRKALVSFCEWHGMQTLAVTASEPPDLAKELE